MSTGGNIVWLGLGLIGFAFLAPSFKSGPPSPPSAEARKPVADPMSQAAPPPARRPPATASPAARFARAPDGHFYLDAQVNGAQVHFLVDTGASMVARLLRTGTLTLHRSTPPAGTWKKVPPRLARPVT